MAESRLPEATLALALRDAGRGTPYPPTPPTSRAGRARPAAEGARRPRPPCPVVSRWSRRPVLALVAVGLIGLLARASAARLGIGAAEVRVQPGMSPSGPPLVPGAIGDPVPVAF